LVGLLIGAVVADLVVPQRLLAQQCLSDFESSEDEDSEPTESPAEDDVVGLCESPQNRIRRQQVLAWQPAGERSTAPRNRTHSYRLSPADLSCRNGIGGPLRC